MSIRAHRVKNIDCSRRETFNINHDEELLNILGDYTSFHNSLNDDGSGIGEILDVEFDNVKEALEKVINNLKTTNNDKIENKEKVEHYRKVLTEMETFIARDGYIQYYCY